MSRRSTAAVAFLALLACLGLPGALDAGALEAAQKQFDAGKYAAAARTLEEALPENSRDAQLHYWLLRCYFEMKDYDRAVQHGERAVELAPNHAVFLNWLGRAYGRKAGRDRSFSLARKTKSAFEKAVQADPRNIQARRDLMQYLAEAPWIAGGSNSGARKQCEAIAALDAVEGHLCWAAYWTQDKKPDRAEAEYRRVLAIGPPRADPYFEAAAFFERRQDAAGVEEAVEAAARVAPAEPRLPYFRGVARTMAAGRGGLAEAERLLLAYLRDVPPRSDRPGHAPAREWLGRVYERLGKTAEAAQQYRAALQLDPRRKTAQEALERLEQKL